MPKKNKPRVRRGGLAGLCFLLMLQGCSSTRPSRFFDPEPGSSASSGLEDYRLRPGDEVNLQIYREPQISGPFRLDRNGQLRHPLMGPVSAEGRTADELEKIITDVLGTTYLVSPRVTVSILAAQSSSVVILGEVKTPGVHPIPLDEPVTLLQAIAKAGGFTALARVNSVTITRTVNGKEHSIRARVARMIAGEESDITLEPNDVIMVPQIIF